MVPVKGPQNDISLSLTLSEFIISTHFSRSNPDEN